MKIIDNQQVSELVTTQEAIATMREAFAAARTGAQQARVRTSSGGVMLSTMGAVLPDAGIAGTKIYTTINGMFRFVIVLFSTETGLPLATIEADTMTGLRTAAATAIATDTLARKDADVLSIIGTGVQARSHLAALTQVRSFKKILIAGNGREQQFVDAMQASVNVPMQAVAIEEAVRSADVLVTVTRAKTPLFSGDLLPQGVFVAAVGASKADVRELDDRAIARAATLVVEWKPQARQEAGDLLLCADGIVDWEKVWELGQAVDGSMAYTHRADDIVIYKAIGVGLEDVALAGLVYRKACAQYGW